MRGRDRAAENAFLPCSGFSDRYGLGAACLRALPALYTGSAPVASQSEDDRAGALRTAFGQVVIKLTGDAHILGRPDVAKAVAGADKYMQQYNYQPNKTGDAGQAAGFVLVVQFDSGRVGSHMLRDLGLNVSDAATATPGADATAMSAAAPGSYRLWISGLRSAEDYAHLIGGLTRNEQVRALNVEQTHGNGVQVRVDTRGPLQSLLESLETTHLAHVTNAKPPVEGVDALLDFEP